MPHVWQPITHDLDSFILYLAMFVIAKTSYNFAIIVTNKLTA